MNALKNLVWLLLCLFFSTHSAVAQPLHSSTPLHYQGQSAHSKDPAIVDNSSQVEDEDDDDFFADDDAEQMSEQDLSRWHQFSNWLSDVRFQAKIGSRVGQKYLANWYNNQNGREILAISLLGLGVFGSGFGLGHAFSQHKMRKKNTQQRGSQGQAKHD